jgi:hypothetical protein
MLRAFAAARVFLFHAKTDAQRHFGGEREDGFNNMNIQPSW